MTKAEAEAMFKTRDGHPLGAGHPIVILECDHHGSSQLIHIAGQWQAINVLDGKILSQKPMSLIAARTMAKECNKRLPTI